MKFLVPHLTTKESAIELVKLNSWRLIEKFGGEMDDIDQDWQENQMVFRCKARGLSLSGTLTITDDVLDVEIEVPLWARALEVSMKDVVANFVTEIIDNNALIQENRL